jgi:hypothetical protein
MMTPLSLEPPQRSAANLNPDGVMPEPALAPVVAERPLVQQPPAPVIAAGAWRFDIEESWYGPGFYDQHTACGEVLTKTLLGVANRTLPCGTLISFKNPVNGKTITVPVVDRAHTLRRGSGISRTPRASPSTIAGRARSTGDTGRRRWRPPGRPRPPGTSPGG